MVRGPGSFSDTITGHRTPWPHSLQILHMNHSGYLLWKGGRDLLVFKAKIGSVNCFKEEESVIVYQVELWRLDHPSLEPRGVEAWQGVAQTVSRHKTLGFNFMKIIFINILAGRHRVSVIRYTLVYLCTVC